MFTGHSNERSGSEPYVQTRSPGRLTPTEEATLYEVLCRLIDADPYSASKDPAQYMSRRMYIPE